MRWGQPRQMTVRSCELGPVISNSPLFSSSYRLALRWMGHRPSDEITAMLRASSASGWPQFRHALESFAVPGLNMLYADTGGHVGHGLAAWIPNHRPADDLVVRDAERWTDVLHAGNLPGRYDPPNGVLASANDQPPQELTDLHIGRFFSPPGRVDRLAWLVEQADAIDLAMLARLQQDVMSETSLRSARRLAQAARQNGPLRGRAARRLQLLEERDGRYDVASRGASLYELLLRDVARRFYPRETLAAYAATWAMRDLIRADLEAATDHALAPLVGAALARLRARDLPPVWGDLHRLRLEEAFAGERCPAAGAIASSTCRWAAAATP